MRQDISNRASFPNFHIVPQELIGLKALDYGKIAVMPHSLGILSFLIGVTTELPIMSASSNHVMARPSSP